MNNLLSWMSRNVKKDFKNAFNENYFNLSVSDDRPLENSVHSEDGRLRHVDDGRAEHRAEDAAVRNGEGAAVHVFNGQLSK